MRITWLLGFLICLSPYWAQAQKGKKSIVSVSPTTHDFGTVEAWKNPKATFVVSNKGVKDMMFLPTFPKHDILVELPKDPIPAGGSAVVYISYYTQTPETFSKTIKLYVNISGEPIILQIKGKIKSMHPEALIACPSIAPKDEHKGSEFELTVMVIDSFTNKPIEGAQVEIFGENFKESNSQTDKEGKKKFIIPIGFYQFGAGKAGYNPQWKEKHVNKGNRMVVLELASIPELIDDLEFTASRRPIEKETPAEIQPVTRQSTEPTKTSRTEPMTRQSYVPPTTKTSRSEPLTRETNQATATKTSRSAPITRQTYGTTNKNLTEPDTDKKTVPTTTENVEIEPTTRKTAETEPTIIETTKPIIKESTSTPPLPVHEKETPIEIARVEPEIDNNGELSIKRFLPNNVVFLIDASASMRKQNKMPVLKATMKRLSEVMRSVDYITVITYNTTSYVVMQTIAAGNKPFIKSKIDSISTYGYTNGIKGLETAFKLADENFIGQGNNQIIIATDGLFNSPRFSERDLQTMIKANTTENIKLSVIGFGGDRDAEKLMKRMAVNGGGNYLLINSENPNLEALVDEIKIQSRVE